MTINRLAMRVGGLSCPRIGIIDDGDNNINGSKCDKINKGGNDNKNWWTTMRW
jgi:hypothetical protein